MWYMVSKTYIYIYIYYIYRVSRSFLQTVDGSVAIIQFIIYRWYIYIYIYIVYIYIYIYIYVVYGTYDKLFIAQAVNGSVAMVRSPSRSWLCSPSRSWLRSHGS